MIKDPIKLRNFFLKKVLSHNYSKGPLLILAGPGTGKTFSLVKTIKTQVKEGMSLKSFCVTTLTNVTVEDLESKICRELNKDFDNVSTLHYRAKGIVHRYADRVALNRLFTIISKDESRTILKDIQQKFLLNKKRIKWGEIKKVLRKYEEGKAKSGDGEIGDFAQYYEQLKKIYNAINWFDVIHLACKILKENTEVFKKETLRQDFILVDEYQDLNPAEQDLIRLLCGNHSNLLVAGDNYQSIYSGRYADPSGITNFQKIYPNATKICLPVSSRCPSVILKASHKLINCNNKSEGESRLELIALHETDERAKGGYIASVGLKSGKAEAEFVGKALETVIAQNKSKAGHIIVLCANRGLGMELMKTIKKECPDIPTHDDLSKNDTEDIQELIVHYLRRFLSRREDNLALRMVLDLLIKASSREIAIILNKILKTNQSLWDTISLKNTLKQLNNREGAISKFVKCIKASERGSLGEKLLMFAQEYPTLRGPIRQVIKGNNEFEETVGSEEPRNVSPKPRTGVRFMTMHSAKGLDAEYVFIPFLEKEIRLPAKDIEEQRRLLYVAITRARVATIMTWAWSRRSAARHKTGGGGYMSRTRSDFIKECGIINDARQDNVLETLQRLSSLN